MTVSRCDECFAKQECIEMCPDCWCASCDRHGDNDDCCLGDVCDRFAPDEEAEANA